MRRFSSGIGRGVVVTTCARAVAEAQRELQHVPGVLRVPPFGELVAPGGVELRAAQAVGILGREHLRDGAVRPNRLHLPRRLELRPLARRVDREQPETPSIMTLRTSRDGLADERDPAAVGEGSGTHPFGAGARLARAAPPRISHVANPSR